ncbi:hypothetical protein [Paenibacillus elgii]|uniref:hypothetical protein n=1 Tax=Paenibacillus elgii TaxID=189691 RepID=UPI000248C7CA|nr:hypothetical protein [Paenibacillus elgii]
MYKVLRCENKITFDNVFKADDIYVTTLDINEFTQIFEQQVTFYNPKENEEPHTLDVSINFRKQNVQYNPFIKTLDVIGSYVFIDGILKFEQFPQHPNSKVVLTIYTLEHEEAVKLKMPIK